MIIIIDGYNVLKQVVTTGDISQRERATFIAQLGVYASLKKHAIVLVFDGGAHDWVHKESVSGIQVIYSGTRQTADEYIEDYLARQAGKEILLVSSDRDLNSRADDLNICSIGAYDFYDIMQAALHGRDGAKKRTKKQASIIKLHSSESSDAVADAAAQELDALMEEAAQGVIPKKDDVKDDLEHAKNLGQKKSTRLDRHLLKILKKL